jgi:hypothetical protein
LCKVSPSPVLVRRQPFIGPVGQGCRMGCQLHVNLYRCIVIELARQIKTKDAKKAGAQLRPYRAW